MKKILIILVPLLFLISITMASGLIDVFTPNGGETLEGVEQILANSYDPGEEPNTTVFFYYKKGSAPDVFIAEATYDGCGTWCADWYTMTVPNGNDYLIRAEIWFDDQMLDYDYSDYYFTVYNDPGSVIP